MQSIFTLSLYLYTAYAPTPAKISPKKITQRKLQPTVAVVPSLPAQHSENGIRRSTKRWDEYLSILLVQTIFDFTVPIKLFMHMCISYCYLLTFGIRC